MVSSYGLELNRCIIPALGGRLRGGACVDQNVPVAALYLQIFGAQFLRYAQKLGTKMEKYRSAEG